MLQTETLIQQTRLLLLDEQIGFVSEKKVFIQNCLADRECPEKGVYQLCTLLQHCEHCNNCISHYLDADKLVNAAKDLLQAARLGVPVPILKKVQSFLYPTRLHVAPQQYDLCITLSTHDCTLPPGQYNIMG